MRGEETPSGAARQGGMRAHKTIDRIALRIGRDLWLPRERPSKNGQRAHCALRSGLQACLIVVPRHRPMLTANAVL